MRSPLSLSDSREATVIQEGRASHNVEKKDRHTSATQNATKRYESHGDSLNRDTTHAQRRRRSLKNFNYDSFLYEVERDTDGFFAQRRDAYHMGEITHVEKEGPNQGGLIVSSRMQRSLWFSVIGNRMGFGLKSITVGRKVWFRLRQNEEKHFSAVQVTPVDLSLDSSEIASFLYKCEGLESPHILMAQILTSQKQFAEILKNNRTHSTFRTDFMKLLKVLAHVSVLGSSSIIAKTDFDALRKVVHPTKNVEAAVFVPTFQNSYDVSAPYVRFFLRSILLLGENEEKTFTINTSSNSIFAILWNFICDDLMSQENDISEIIQQGADFFPVISSARDYTPLTEREFVLVLKFLLGVSVLLNLDSKARKLMLYMARIIGNALVQHKDSVNLNILIPVLQSIYVTLSSMESVLSESYRILFTDHIDRSRTILQSASTRITLRNEEVQYQLKDRCSPFHIENVADLDIQRSCVFEHIHAHYVAIRAEFYVCLVRNIRSSIYGDDSVFASSTTLTSGDRTNKQETLRHDAVRNVRFVGIHIDHTHGMCLILEVRMMGIKTRLDAFSKGALLTFVTGTIDMNKNTRKRNRGSCLHTIDESAVYSLCVNDAIVSESRALVSVRPVEQFFPWSQFIGRMRQNEEAISDQTRPTALKTTMFLQQSFFPAFEPVLNRLNDFLRLPPVDFPFEYVFSDKQMPQTCTVIPSGYEQAFAHIIDKVHARYTLDESQSDVMQALRKFPVLLVQGPPGTGKSFIGTRIVEAFTDFRIHLEKCLLSNFFEVKENVNTGTPKLGPILIVTFKNHSLDEFLKDILRTGLWCGMARSHHTCACKGDNRGCCVNCCKHVKGVVRLGTRTHEKEILKYTLGELMDGKEKQPSYMDGLKRCGIIKDRAVETFRRLNAMKSGRIPTGLFLKYLTATQRSSFSLGADEISKEIYAKESYFDPFGDDFLVSVGVALEFGRWLHGEERQAMFDEKVKELTNEAFKVKTSLYREAFEGIRKRLIEQKILKKVVTVGAEIDRLTNYEEVEAGGQTDWLFDGLCDSSNGSLDVDAVFDTSGFNVKLETIIFEARNSIEEYSAPSISAVCPWVLSLQERHDFIAHIIEYEVLSGAQELARFADEYKKTREYLKRIRQEEELDVLRHADVIAATSTGCTMHIEQIQQLAPSVIIIEEAAEILEAHVIACLTSSMKQMVLIGDHKQLRPRIENYDLIENHHVNISLFERLAKSSYPLIRLNNQRRMQKDIADLIRPFYAQHNYKLDDHYSVSQVKLLDVNSQPFLHSPGIPAKACLWDHEFPESKANHGYSVFNEAEVAMTVYLVIFLLSQGVRQTSITVVTPYVAQQRAMIKALRKHVTDHPHLVKVVTVDRFQGDENDIIVLSLVRTQNLTDFLQLENRMIVACSRARFLLVMLGSKKLLQQSPHWKQVLRLLGKNIYRKLPIFKVKPPYCDSRISAEMAVREVDRASESGERFLPPFE